MDVPTTKEGQEKGETRWTPVPDTFTSAQQYVEVWFPLLLQEMQAQTLSEVQTDGLGPFTKVSLLCLPFHNCT